MIYLIKISNLFSFTIERTPVMRGKNSFYSKYIKRILDIICSLVGIVLFCWLFAIVAILVKIKLGSPVIYKANRPGKIDPKTGEEKIFKLCKFRSMSNETDENGKLLPDTQRLTKFGRILRATSLDELPEIFNILKGDMSIVGPRPLGIKYIPYYTEQERHRHDVSPGLTGLAQIRGRNNLSWEEKFAYDVEYVNNVSLFFDIRILFETVIKVVKREGIGQGEQRPVSLHIERAERVEKEHQQ